MTRAIASEPAAGARLTPMMAQYWDVKRAHRDALVLFRMGDFYETFYDDAKVAARVLGLTLTTRDKTSAHPVPLAGVPFHAAEAYIARLLRAGYKVAVCDQIEDAALARGLVRRAVTEVLTPGTALVPSLLPERDGHYALCLAVQGDETAESLAGYAFIDISTGEFGLGERRLDALGDVVARFAPGEVFLPQTALGTQFEMQLSRRFEGTPISYLEDAGFSPRIAIAALKEHFGVVALEGLGCADLPRGVAAAGALLDLGTRLRRGRLHAVTRLQVQREADEVMLDEDTLAHLEVFRPLRGTDPAATLVHHLDDCRTAMGSRLLRGWLRAPLRDRERAGARHTAVAWWTEHPDALESVRAALAGLGDLERLMGRIAADRATPRDLGAFAEICDAIPGVAAPLATTTSPLLEALSAQLDPLAELAAAVRRTLVDEPPSHVRDPGFVRPGASAELDTLLAETRAAREWIAGLQASERAATGIAKLKVGFNKVFGYYLEVPRAHVSRVPSQYTAKQTLVNATRFVTPELKDREQIVLRAEAQRLTIETALFQELRARIAAQVDRVHRTAAALAAVDVLANFAHLARKRDYVRPQLTGGDRIVIRDGRHPVVERLLDAAFVPNDVDLGGSNAQILLVTGPNMGGKSTFLRQIALIVLLANAGSFVPASAAEIGSVDRIFTRVGASDNLARGQSTFLVEMTETAKILNTCTNQSLLILDEVGRGTSTHDGMSLAWAILEHLHDGPAHPRTLFATHYHELTVLEDSLARVRNVSVEIREWQDELLFVHRVRPGRADKSYGIQVARLAGLPRAVIERARTLLLEHERMESRLGTAAEPEHVPPVQMDLFGGPERAVANALRDVDLENLSPEAAKALLLRLRHLL